MRLFSSLLLLRGVLLVAARDKLQQLRAAVPLARDALHLIAERYEYHTPLGRAFLLMQSNLSEQDFLQLKYSLATKMLSEEDPTYLMVFGGSSVTAGHDNQFLDSYPQVVEQELGPVFAAAGIQLVVRNIAQAANLCLPSDMCYPAMGGEEQADFYSWEQSMNCGHQNEYPELVMRLAAANGGMYYHASSGGVIIKCPKSKESPPFCSPEFKPKPLSNESKTVLGMRESVSNWKRDLFEMNHAAGASGSAAIPDALIDRYSRRISIGGFDKSSKVFPDKICKDLALPSCTVSAIYSSCGLKYLSNEASLFGSANGKGASWHPTKSLHLLRGELLVWLYALATLDSLLMLIADPRLAQQSAWDAMRREYTSMLKSAKNRSVPKPWQCGKDPLYCDVPSECYTDFGPHYSGKLFLSELIVKSAVKNRWEYSESIVTNHQPDRSKAQLETRPRYQTSHGDKGGELYIRIRVKPSLPIVMVCWAAWTTIKQSYFNHIEFRMELNVNESVGTSGNLYTPSNDRLKWDDSSNKDLQHKDCVMLRNIPAGSHILGLESKLDKSPVGVTHVIMWDGR